MPIDDLIAQRRSLGAARLPDGRSVAEIPGAYGCLVVVLTVDGPQLQGSALTPADCEECADAARDTAVAVARGEADLIEFVTECWERRRRRRAGREANAILRAAEEPR